MNCITHHAACDCREFKFAQLDHALKGIYDWVQKQAEDESLWMIPAHIETAYVQQELRKLHDVIENNYENIQIEKCDQKNMEQK